MRVVPLLILCTIAALAMILLTSDGVMVIRSGSMEPNIHVGDVIIGRTPTDAIKVGDVITYQHDDMSITHRVVEVLPDGLRTKGDANNAPDAWIVPQGAVRRVFVRRVPYVGYFVAFLKTREGWFAAVLLPAILFIVSEVLAVLREIWRSDQPAEAH